jgi:hypothetical protein
MEEIPAVLSSRKNALVTNARTALKGCQVPTTDIVRSQSCISVSVQATTCPLRTDLPGRMLLYIYTPIFQIRIYVLSDTSPDKL